MKSARKRSASLGECSIASQVAEFYCLLNVFNFLASQYWTIEWDCHEKVDSSSINSWLYDPENDIPPACNPQRGRFPVVDLIENH